MRRRIALATAMVALGVGWAALTHTGGSSPGGDAAAAVPRGLSEEFNGRGLNRRIWNKCHWWDDGGCTIASNDELEWYLPDQVSVANGVLRLRASRREVFGSDGRRYRYASGMISSGPPRYQQKPRYAFTFGHAEIRARVPSGKGLWPTFWLLPADSESRPEIDVMEFYAHPPRVSQMHLHTLNADDERVSRGRKWRGPDFSKDWHTFAIDWSPGQLVWLIDGKERWRLTGNLVPDEPMYLVANLAVGGAAGPPSGNATPAELLIDYIRVEPAPVADLP